MNTLLVCEFVNLLCAGLLAGAEMVVHVALPGPTETLAAPAQIVFRQALTRRLRVLVPALFGPMALSGIAVATLGRNDPSAALRDAGVLAVLAWIVTRAVGTVPINSAVLDWPPDAPPANWKVQIARAERFHVAGLGAALLAFACFLAAALRLAGP